MKTLFCLKKIGIIAILANVFIIPISIVASSVPIQDSEPSETKQSTASIVSATPTSAAPSSKRTTRQENYYNYRTTNYEDDRNYAYYEGDTRGNYVSDFGLRTNRPSARVSNANPFEAFGRGGARDRDRDDVGGYEGRGSSSNSNSGGLRNRLDYEDDYSLLDDSNTDGRPTTGRGDDYYDDYQQEQPQYEQPAVEGRRFGSQQETGRNRGRGRIRITSTAPGGGGSGGWPGGTYSSWQSTGARRPGDASYSFGYSTIDQSRYEISDSFGNINGFYSYVDDDGILRHVSYTAGADTGFRVNQNRVAGYRPPPPYTPRVRPTIPDSPSLGWDVEEEENLYPPTQIPDRTRQPGGLGWPGKRRRPSVVVKIRRPLRPTDPPAEIYFRPPNPGKYAPGRRPSGSSSSGGGWRPSPSSPLPPRRRPGTRPTKFYPDEDINSGSGINDGSWTPDTDRSPYPMDASYHFAYDAGSHNRNEYSDPWGNVRGSYSYIDPDGVRRTVHYSAGAVSGFKVLSASPSEMISRIYRDPLLPPALMRIRPKPSAFVYHLHSDSGWKPWEASETNIIRDRTSSNKRLQGLQKARNRNDNVAESYQYQSPNIDTITSSEEEALQQNNTVIHENTRPASQLDVQALANRRAKSRHRGGGGGNNGGWTSTSSSYSERSEPRRIQQQEPQEQQNQYQRPQFEQIYDQDIYNDGYDDDDEFQMVADSKYEALKSQNGKVTTIRGYKGGYGDKNPLLVMSESSTRPRESSSTNNNDQMMAMQQMMTTTRPISVARLMSMRMAKSRKKMKIKSTKEHKDSSSSSFSSSSSSNGNGSGGSSSRKEKEMMMKMLMMHGGNKMNYEPTTMEMLSSSKNNNNNNNPMSNHHSSMSQSQSFPDDDIMTPAAAAGDFQSLPLAMRAQQMKIMSQERRLAHYPKSYKHEEQQSPPQLMEHPITSNSNRMMNPRDQVMMMIMRNRNQQ